MILACIPVLRNVMHRRIEAVMGFFRTARATARLQDRLEKLADRLADLERDMRTAKLESLETYDKIHRLFGRIAKRTAIDHPPPGAPEPPETPEPGAVDDISARILARRSMGKP